MPKSRGRKRKATQQSPARSPAKTENEHSIFSRLFAGFLAVCTIVGTLVIFYPRITVDAPREPLGLSGSPTDSFTIANTGLMPLTEVRPMFGICSMGLGLKEEPFPRKCSGPLPKIPVAAWARPTLGVDERYAIALVDAVKANIEIAAYDVSIAVRFRPWILPFTREKEFRFVTRKMSDERTYWFAQPLGE